MACCGGRKSLRGEGRCGPTSWIAWWWRSIHHRGNFPALKQELMAMGTGENEAKVDRADACVWAITALNLTANLAALPSIEQL